ncbi:MAG: histidinol dehydrogenase [Candidatus Hadarchaeota archaeon]|nr:histidinol dehydrogenase [Candidatus Hadarchaeota archaeon]
MRASPLRIVRLWRYPKRYYGRLLRRSEGDVARVLHKVRRLVAGVRDRGDRALLEYTKKFDGVELSREQLRVSSEEIRAAYREVDPKTVEAIETAARFIRRFHRKQLPKEWFTEFERGVGAGQLVRPLASVGVYAPGGLAKYPSSVLMAVVPAKVAGVERVIVCTPPRGDGRVDPAMLVAADVAGADEVYKIGGAQAIAAMAYGTRTIPRVDKIVGPGNIYVAAAKQVVAPDVGVDFAAGPSEVLVLADSSASSRKVTVDLMAQAEHDPLAAAVLVTTSEKLALDVCEQIRSMLKRAKRRKIISRSLREYGLAVVTRSMEEAIEFANYYAPEHLQLLVRKPKRVLRRIRNAGAIFIGPFTPVAAGDFAIGPSHVLPTGGIARRRAGLSVLDFVRMPSVQKLTKRGLRRLAGVVEKLAEVEGLPAHARSIRERLGR